MRFLIIFIFLLSNSLANEVTDLKNIVINKDLKKYDGLTFLDAKKKELNLNDYNGNLILQTARSKKHIDEIILNRNFIKNLI